MSQFIPDIDFTSIRPLKGSQRDGFEELGTQLFAGETEGKGILTRVEGSGGDGGVESYRTNEDGEKIGFQAKYYDKLSDSQWTHITNSVKTAIKNHPTLLEYIVAVPLNRNPTQVKKWDTLTAKWRKFARDSGIKHEIKVTWWGFSELQTFLIKPEYRGQLIYWLGVAEFSLDWLTQKNQISISQLDKRYSPKQHVQTEAGWRLDAFSHGEIAKNKLLEKYHNFGELWRNERRRITPESFNDKTIISLVESFLAGIKKIEAVEWPDSGYPKLAQLEKNCSETKKACWELFRQLREINEEERKRRGLKNGEYGPYDSEIRDLGQIEDALGDLLSEIERCRLADEKSVLLFGEAGTGKSHVIADLINISESRSQPTLFLLGESFLSSEAPWSAVLKILDWEYSVDDLLAAMNQQAQLAGLPALFCIDALNESEHRKLWHSHLIQFEAKFSKYEHVKLLVSCRSDFIPITLPDALQLGSSESWPHIKHTGFGGEVIEAIEHYFEAFGVKASHFPPALDEFRNPLFLRVFCEAFENKRIPEGPLSLDLVMKARVKRLCEQIEHEIDCDPEDTKAALRACAKIFAASGGKPVRKSTLRPKVMEHSPTSGSSKSLYQRLVSNGMLIERVVDADPDSDEPIEYVRFPYERFADYFIANEILEEVDTLEKFKLRLGEDEKLEFLQDEYGYYRNRGVARALAILVPEKHGFELAEIIEVNDHHYHIVLEDFLDSFPWRSGKSFNTSTKQVFQKAQSEGFCVISTLMRVATIPGHPYNSIYLGNRLQEMMLPDREVIWTIPVSEQLRRSDSPIVDSILDWCFRAPINLIPNDQARLIARFLIWLCTTNDRGLRERATLAAIRILIGRPKLVTELVEEFAEVDDPYLIERLYAVAAGVALRELPSGELSELGELVYHKIFAQGDVTPNILIRDYARSVLETCNAKGCLPDNIEVSVFRPRYHSTWPKILSDKEAKRFESDETWEKIVSSVRPEKTGWYGDFGRYVMGYKVHFFSNQKLSEDPPEKDDRSTFSDMVARNWILQRVEELGWTGERFGEYERKLPNQGRQRSDIEESKSERISKKYQWIALRELQGYLSDHYWLARPWDDTYADFEGAWQISGRGFDPSQLIINPKDKIQVEIEGKYSWQSEYPDPFGDPDIQQDKEKWLTTPPENFQQLLTPVTDVPTPEYQWLNLSGHYKWNEPKTKRLTQDPSGELRMWLDIRSFLVQRDLKEDFISKVQKLDFSGDGIDYPKEYNGWIGEYPWGSVFKKLREWCYTDDPWIKDAGIPYDITVCSWSEDSMRIPSPLICDLLNLNWSGEGGSFHLPNGELCAGHIGGEIPTWGRPCIVRRDQLLKTLDEENLAIVWCALAEKTCWCSQTLKHVFHKTLESSAVYWLEGEDIVGEISRTKINEF